MDSPKHIACLELGKTGQFYRIAGQNKYKCKSCGVIESGTVFQPLEFQWKSNPDAWRQWKENIKKNEVKKPRKEK